ncbi:hypothetical protein ACFV0T_25530 [Streptomyces sp. NPDC059582]|uniref:hypothetical protein n=1 Tax=Streptomyces sp. NPDC059582 TaxID=3346875 RepID=UPI0036915BE5
MPAIEFIGYSRDEAVERMERYIPLFAHLDWADDFIFQIEPDNKVIGLNRIEQPLVRVRSRFPERIEITRDILRDHEDVESFVIDFRARRVQD